MDNRLKYKNKTYKKQQNINLSDLGLGTKIRIYKILISCTSKLKAFALRKTLLKE